ncbi:MAG: adhesion protein FadA [Fusobacteriaceae bacterium]
MKKLMMTLALLGALTTVTYSESDIRNSLKSIENEFKLLEQREKEKFREEEEKNKVSQQKYSSYALMINKINERLTALNVSEKTSFFPQEQKKLSENYKKIDKELRIGATEEKRKIEEFNQLKSILGY